MGKRTISPDRLYRDYREGKQTLHPLSFRYGLSLVRFSADYGRFGVIGSFPKIKT